MALCYSSQHIGGTLSTSPCSWESGERLGGGRGRESEHWLDRGIKRTIWKEQRILERRQEVRLGRRCGGHPPVCSVSHPLPCMTA